MRKFFNIFVKQPDFALTEGATHVVTCGNNRKVAFTLPEGTTHVVHWSNSRKIAFTLAEVLIILGIIGVVAAMTMPSLITNYQKKQTVTQLKKAYSELYQAIKVSEKDYGTMEGWSLEGNGGEQIKDFSNNYLFPNIKILKSCIPSTNECWADNILSLGGVEPLYDNPKNGVRASFIAASGYTVYYWLHSTGGWFWVDVNGLKKPNIVGKDIFVLYLTFSQTTSNACPDGTLNRVGFFPLGASCEAIKDRESLLDGSNYACKKDRSLKAAGAYCGSLIMFDGWEIEKDYPW